MPTIFPKTIKKRIDFLKVSKNGKKIFTKGFILQKYKRNMDSEKETIRVGFTITKKIGGAVVRNKIKRRFRAIMREIFAKYLKKNYDYVIIANKKSLIMDYKELKSDVIKTVK
jgi:ribonuclease P protein component